MLFYKKFIQFYFKYKTLFKQLDGLLYLKAKNFGLLRNWRLKQERKLLLNSKKNSKLKIMNKEDVLRNKSEKKIE